MFLGKFTHTEYILLHENPPQKVAPLLNKQVHLLTYLLKSNKRKIQGSFIIQQFTAQFIPGYLYHAHTGREPYNFEMRFKPSRSHYTSDIVIQSFFSNSVPLKGGRRKESENKMLNFHLRHKW